MIAVQRGASYNAYARWPWHAMLLTRKLQSIAYGEKRKCLTGRVRAGAKEPEDKNGKLQLLVEVFPTMEPALVRDVLDGFQGDSERAMQHLLHIQV